MTNIIMIEYKMVCGFLFDTIFLGGACGVFMFLYLTVLDGLQPFIHSIVISNIKSSPVNSSLILCIIPKFSCLNDLVIFQRKEFDILVNFEWV